MNLPEKLKELCSYMGRRGDDEELVTYIANTYGKKTPQTSTPNDSSKYIELRKKFGIDILFTHEVVHERFPPIAHRKSFRPYFYYIFVYPESSTNDFYPKDIQVFTDEFGPHQATNSYGAKIWRIPVNDTLRMIFMSDVEKNVMEDTYYISLIESEWLAGDEYTNMAGGLFIRYCIKNKLLHPHIMKEHNQLIQQISSGELNGTDLIQALPRNSFWTAHLIDDDSLRENVHDYFRGLKKFRTDSIHKDMLHVFGERKIEYDTVPDIDEDTISNYNKIEPVFSNRISW